MNQVTINTLNGPVALEPIFCEITGEQICWIRHGYNFDPVYVSFDVIDVEGNQKIPTDDVRTF